MGCGVWREIVRVGEEMDELGLEFTSSCKGILGDWSDIKFWLDRWVDDRILCDRFSRLFHLDMGKEGSVRDKRKWVNGSWHWEWEWRRSIRGRVCNELVELVNVLQIVVSNNCRDRWRWTLDEDEGFKAKVLSRLIEEKILHVENGTQETLWNKLVPKKAKHQPRPSPRHHPHATIFTNRPSPSPPYTAAATAATTSQHPRHHHHSPHPTTTTPSPPRPRTIISTAKPLPPRRPPHHCLHLLATTTAATTTQKGAFGFKNCIKGAFGFLISTKRVRLVLLSTKGAYGLVSAPTGCLDLGLAA
ncbi:hypothetical protein Tco_0763482 [Tanacetum coccineum]